MSTLLPDAITQLTSATISNPLAQAPLPNHFLQPKVTGYRQLSQDEVDTMNHLKEMGNKIGEMIAAMMTRPDFDQRWVSIGATDMQTGLMALTRSVARPTSF